MAFELSTGVTEQNETRIWITYGEGFNGGEVSAQMGLYKCAKIGHEGGVEHPDPKNTALTYLPVTELSWEHPT